MSRTLLTGFVSLASAGSVCLGRKLATCFYDVNNFAELFSPGRRRAAAGGSRRAVGKNPRTRRRVSAPRNYLPSFSLFSFAMRRRARAAKMPANIRRRVRSGVLRRGRERSRAGGEIPARTVEMRKTAQTFRRRFRRLRRLVAIVRTRAGGFAPAKKNRPREAAGSFGSAGRVRVSGLPRPAVRRSRPATAARRAGRHRRAARRTASPRRTRPR